jgi:hypothetical protein
VSKKWWQQLSKFEYSEKLIGELIFITTTFLVLLSSIWAYLLTYNSSDSRSVPATQRDNLTFYLTYRNYLFLAAFVYLIITIYMIYKRNDSKKNQSILKNIGRPFGLLFYVLVSYTLSGFIADLLLVGTGVIWLVSEHLGLHLARPPFLGGFRL